MAKQKNNRTGTYILIGILCLIVGAFIIFCVNNFTEQKPYDVISCTFNKYNCNITAPQQDIPDWNGECTGEIVDECCTPIRTCNGQITQNPMECFTYYCFESNHYCSPEWDKLGGYVCTCKDSEYLGEPLLY